MATESVDALLDVDHRRLHGLLVELRRMPTTPGVVRSVFDALRREVDVHLDAVRDVLLVDLDAARQEPVVSAALADHARLRNRLADLEGRLLRHPDLRPLEAALDAHVRHETGEVVERLRHDGGLHDLDELADDYDRRRDHGMAM